MTSGDSLKVSEGRRGLTYGVVGNIRSCHKER